jgi:hypothetical protein
MFRTMLGASFLVVKEGRADDRFEQTNLDLQPNAPSAMGMVAEDPIRLVDGRRASCDGGELLLSVHRENLADVQAGDHSDILEYTST